MTGRDKKTDYDYIVVGAGSAGCVLAYRLARRTSAQVLLIEAGGPDKSPLIRMPIGFAALVGENRHNWGYQTATEAGLGGRRVDLPRGRVLGGCSSINGMVYIRGQAGDYDGWAARGNVGWDYASLLPLFKKTEDHWRGANAYHGTGGELAVRPIASPLPIADRFIEAAQEDGLPYNADFNGATQAGAGHFDTNISGGVRHNTARAFLHRDDPPANLTVLTHALVDRVLFDAGRASGVRLARGKRMLNMSAREEVILCAGALHSPQILERSGVGEPKRLRSHGISVVHANPAVGEHLQDHFNTLVTVATDGCRTYYDDIRPRRLAGTLLDYCFRRRGIFANPAATTGAFLSVDGSDRPDAQIHFAPAASSKQDNGRLKPIPGICASICRLHPASVGSVHIASASMHDTPSIRMNYLQAGDDAAFQVRAVRRLRNIFRQSAIGAYISKETLPGSSINDDTSLLAFIRETGDSVHHPVGSCRMGLGQDSVVDPQLRVHGVDGLRVADASIFPTVISGNTHAPSVMVAEKAANMILNSP